VPIALSLLRRIRSHHTERSRLLEYALSASDRERREIATGLHDNVVQNLAGAGYALSSLERDVPTDRRPGARAALSTVQASVESLRGLLLDLAPSDLTATALPRALDGLLAPLHARGLSVTSSVCVPEGVHDAVAVVLYRITREWLAHLADHAWHLGVEISPDGPLGTSGSGVRMRITDDAPTPLRPDSRHRDDTGRLGLALLRDRVTALGGTFDAAPRRDGGTEITVVFPDDYH
jgi:signal transduction histidine kinase